MKRSESPQPNTVWKMYPINWYEIYRLKIEEYKSRIYPLIEDIMQKRDLVACIICGALKKWTAWTEHFESLPNYCSALEYDWADGSIFYY